MHARRCFRVARRAWVVFVLTLVSAAADAALYTYTGNPFTSYAVSPWNSSMRVSGSFTVATPLAPGLPMGTDIRGTVQTFAFTDGVQTRDQSNSHACTFSVGTDSAGAITSWTIELRESPPPPTGNQSWGIDTIFTPPGSSVDQGYTFASTGSQCDAIAVPRAGVSYANPGAWALVPLPVPTLSVVGLLALASLVGLAGVLLLARFRPRATH